MTELNSQYASIFKKRRKENDLSGIKFQEYMNSSTAVFQGTPVKCAFMPKFFSDDTWAYMQKSAGIIYGILEKVINKYIECPEYRLLFPFSPELENLILTEAGYDCKLPITRIDLFLNEDDLSFKFCEFNADGTSAMNEDRELLTAHHQTDVMQEFLKTHEVMGFELFDSWVNEFGNIYDTYKYKKTNPRIVIADFTDKATPNEFIIFKAAFEKGGFVCDIVDIRTLKFENNELQTEDGKRIDAVYRRAVTRDIMERFDEVQPLINAVKANAVCLIGHFRTQIIHHKALFAILRMKESLDFMSAEEAEFIDKTIPLTFYHTKNEPMSKDAFNNKDNWILKPEDLYGSRGVYIGKDLNQDEWENALKETQDKNYLLQVFAQPFKTENIDYNEENAEIRMFNNITGLFMYNGKLQGIYTRISVPSVISPTTGRTIGSMIARKKS